MSKYVWVASIPSSMIAIFIPFPDVSSPVPQSLSAPITSGPWAAAVPSDTRALRVS